ncbi:hypothetical protein KMZ32_10575 [Phycicoccus sp. MAQZ13P-2]|uniref:hypothetical protein n=1 Tax=Phycicoccus mangrovi TaxID=2840470 RepID=UPI001C001B54|nr:hypothetical protein [Phycicoccus mangrovi]MBT9255919.1 hypothetical protein [Phycicoccus mangrovi]MBT9274513.1 hypothetical protein [Phycicoccus mangrovi]
MLSVALLAPLGLLLLAWSWRGLDPIDESYVLRLVRHPEASLAAGEVYLFPFVLHPLLELCGNDVGLFRLVGNLLVAGIAVGLVLEAAPLVAERRSRLAVCAAAVTTAVAAQLVFLLEVRVLSYRSLAFAGLLVLAWGVARVQRGRPGGGGALVGLGTWTVFVAKPTSAVAAAVVLLVLLAWVRPPGRTLVTATAALVSSAALTLAVAGLGPVGAVRYLAGGLDVVSRLGAYPGLAGMLGISPVHPVFFLLTLPPIVVLAAWVVARRRVTDVAALDLATSAVLVTTAVCLAAVAVVLLSPATLGYGGFSLGVVVLGAALGAVRLVPEPRRSAARPVLVLLGLVPYLYAVGSNRDLVTTTGQTSAAWVALVGLAAVATVPTGRQPGPPCGDDVARGRIHAGPPAAPVLLLTSAACVVVMAATLLWDGPAGPGIARATEPVRVLGGSLLVPADQAAVLGRLRDLSRRDGVLDDTPVVDLTGSGAAYALALGGRPLGRAHFYTAWSGGVDSARTALARVPCDDRARAWLVVPAGDPPPLAAAWTDDWSATRRGYGTADTFTGYARGAGRRFAILRPGPAVAGLLGCSRTPPVTGARAAGPTGRPASTPPGDAP